MANPLIDLQNEKTALLEEYAKLNETREESDTDNPRFGEIEAKVKQIEHEEKRLTRADWLTSKSAVRSAPQIITPETRNPGDIREYNSYLQNWILGKGDSERVMTFGNNDTGGYMSVPTLDSRIRECILQDTSLLRYMTVETHAGLEPYYTVSDCDDNDATAAAEYTGPGSGGHGAEQAPDNGQPDFNRKTINKFKYVSGKVAITREEALNPNLNHVERLSRQLSRRLVRKINELSQVGTGNGADAPEGVFGVAPEGKELADKDAITLAELIDWRYSVPEDVRNDPNTIMVVHDSTLAAFEKLDDGKYWQGSYVADQTGRLVYQVKGIKIVTSVYMPPIGTASSTIGIIGNLKDHLCLFVGGPLGSELTRVYDQDTDTFNLNYIQFFGCGWTGRNAADYMSALVTPAS